MGNSFQTQPLFKRCKKFLKTTYFSILKICKADTILWPLLLSRGNWRGEDKLRVLAKFPTVPGPSEVTSFRGLSNPTYEVR